MNHRTDNRKVKPEPSNKQRRPFFEDFNMEHSSSAGTRFAMSTTSASTVPATPRNSHPQNQHSPSCVYLG
jgi:hypothetical protein